DVVHARVVETRVTVVVDQHLGVDLRQIGQIGGLGHTVRDIDAEAVHAAVQPEPQGLLEIGGDLGIVPVQVGLFGGEQVQVPLAGAAVGLGDSGPGRAAENARPVVRRQLALGAAAVA